MVTPTLALAGTQKQGERQVVDRVVAVIEDEVITLRELEAKAQSYMDELSGIDDAQRYAERRKALLEKVLDIQIGEKIVQREIERNREKLGVKEGDVDRAIDEVLRMNNITRQQLRATLYGQGMTWSEYRQKMRDQIARARLIQFKVKGKIQIDEQDVRRRCLQRQQAKQSEDRVCAAHILLKIPDAASKESIERLRARAEKLRAELTSGADFAAYALKHSDDQGAPDGDIGCFGRGEMLEEFARAAFQTPVGEIAPLVQSDFGFHIIKVRERKSAASGSCNAAEDLKPFRQELYQEAMQREMDAWIDSLREKAFVDVRL